MIFKAVNGVLSPKVAHLWNSRLTLSENVSAALDLTAKHLGHYKNRIALNWTTFNPQEVNGAGENSKKNNFYKSFELCISLFLLKRFCN